MQSEYKVGDWVIAKKDIKETGIFHARAGDLGEVIALYPDSYPTIRWNRTVTDCTPSEVEPAPLVLRAPTFSARRARG